MAYRTCMMQADKRRSAEAQGNEGIKIDDSLVAVENANP